MFLLLDSKNVYFVSHFFESEGEKKKTVKKVFPCLCLAFVKIKDMAEENIHNIQS